MTRPDRRPAGRILALFVTLVVTLVAALVAACAGVKLPEVPGLDLTGFVKEPSPSEVAATDAADKARPVSKDFTQTPDDIKAMLIRSDPKACSATSDATLAETAVLYARIGAAMGTSLLITEGFDEARLQSSLNKFRPYLRELSRNTNWLPLSAERLVGERIVAINDLQAFVPPARQRPLLDNTIRPIYTQLVAYARDDLKSPVQFELRLVRDDQSTAPSAIAGGIILIPSGLFTAMQRVKEPDQVMAFMLAHEFSHVLRRHKTKMVQLSLVDSITVAGEYKKLYNSAAAGRGAATDPAALLQFTGDNVKSLMDLTCQSQNWLPTMEQNQEFEADVCGALLLRKLAVARKTPYDAVRGYAAYLGNGLASPVPPEKAGHCVVQTSHPTPERRMENLQAYALAPEAARPKNEVTPAAEPPPGTPASGEKAPSKGKTGKKPPVPAKPNPAS